MQLDWFRSRAEQNLDERKKVQIVDERVTCCTTRRNINPALSQLFSLSWRDNKACVTVFLLTSLAFGYHERRYAIQGHDGHAGTGWLLHLPEYSETSSRCRIQGGRSRPRSGQEKLSQAFYPGKKDCYAVNAGIVAVFSLLVFIRTRFDLPTVTFLIFYFCLFLFLFFADSITPTSPVAMWIPFEHSNEHKLCCRIPNCDSSTIFWASIWTMTRWNKPVQARMAEPNRRPRPRPLSRTLPVRHSRPSCNLESEQVRTKRIHFVLVALLVLLERIKKTLFTIP